MWPPTMTMQILFCSTDTWHIYMLKAEYYWHCPHSMWSRVYETVEHLSVRLSHWSTAAACGGFAAVGPPAWRYRSIAARPALSSNCECEQCHVVSWRRNLNTDCSLVISLSVSARVQFSWHIQPGRAGKPHHWAAKVRRLRWVCS